MRCSSSRSKGPTSLSALVTAAVAVVGLAGCASGTEQPGDGDEGRISIVTSTNVYGSIAGTVGGGNVEVTPIIDSVNQDPHSYEATVRDKLEVSKADLVIENGGGYDPFLHQLVEDADKENQDVLSAVEAAGLDVETHPEASHEGHQHGGHSHGGANEHVWYDLTAMSELSQQIAAGLGEADPANAATYKSNAEEFTAGIEKLQQQVGKVKKAHQGAGVAITEPVPVHLLEAAGLHNMTPAEFSQAVEEGHGVSPAVLQQMLQLLSKKQVQFLAYNSQTAGSQTEDVKQAARDSGVPVVSFTETLPESADYLEWMGTNVDNIEKALGG